MASNSGGAEYAKSRFYLGFLREIEGHQAWHDTRFLGTLWFLRPCEVFTLESLGSG